MNLRLAAFCGVAALVVAGVGASLLMSQRSDGPKETAPAPGPTRKQAQCAARPPTAPTLKPGVLKDATFEISNRDVGSQGGEGDAQVTLFAPVSTEHATLPDGVKLTVERSGCEDWNISYAYDLPQASRPMDMKSRLLRAADLIHETAPANQEAVVDLNLLERQLREMAARQTPEPDETLLFQGTLHAGVGGTYYSVGLKPLGKGRQLTVAYWTGGV